MMLHRFSQFCFGISAIQRSIQKIERDEMESRGFKGAFAQYLVVMVQYPDGVTASQLCDLCDRDKAAVSRAVTEMEERGLITRQGKSYRARLFLTPLGEETARFVCSRAVVAVAEAGKGLSEEERAAFYRVLERIAANLQEICKDGLPDLRGE